MSRTERVEDAEATEHGTVSESVERRIEKRAKGRAAIRAASDCAIQNVEERGEPEEESADRDVPRPIDDAAGDGARGADGGNSAERRGCRIAGSGPTDRPIVRAVIGVSAAAVPAVVCVGD